MKENKTIHLRLIEKPISITLTLLMFWIIPNIANAQIKLNANEQDAKQLKPAMLYWDFGSPEYLTIESIYTTNDSANTYWHVVHRSPVVDDTSGNGFDYYQINEKNLRPVVSQMYHLGFINYLINFNENKAKLSIKNGTDTTEYEVIIPAVIAPEGPGTSVFLGSLKLRKNYHIEYYELSRWAGKSPQIGQLELTELKVVDTEKLYIDGKRYKTFKILITNKSGRHTEVWALKNAPHYWVKVNHKISENSTMQSKVVKILFLK